MDDNLIGKTPETGPASYAGSSEGPRLGRARGLAWVARVVLVVSMGCLFWVGWSLSEAALVEAVEDRRLEQARSSLVHSTALTRSAHPENRLPQWEELEEGDLVGRIHIDRLDLSAIVQAGTSARTLRRAVGHIPGTARPGERGNVGLAGHRDSFFRDLSGAVPGDTIALKTPHGDFVYQVDTVFIVDPDEVWVLDPPANGTEKVTLVSCYPFYYVGPAPRRFIVQGERLATEASVEADHPRR